MQVREAIQWAVGRLAKQSGSPRLDAELLLGWLLSRDRAWLRAHDDAVLDVAQSEAFHSLVDRRASGEPIAYLLGEQEFWSLPLRVSRHTLIPRPETELLVETVLRLAPAACREVLDLGTGTGAIALALKHERPDWQLLAVDRIPEAVSLAQQNAHLLGVEAECLVSNWYGALPGRKFHVIVSNPPYIDEADPHLVGDGVMHEPHSALVAEHEGLSDLQCIVSAAPEHLLPGGLLAVEHGWGQGEQVRALFIRSGFSGVQTLEDMAGQPRVTFGFWKLSQPDEERCRT